MRLNCQYASLTTSVRSNKFFMTMAIWLSIHLYKYQLTYCDIAIKNKAICKSVRCLWCPTMCYKNINHFSTISLIRLTTNTFSKWLLIYYKQNCLIYLYDYKIYINIWSQNLVTKKKLIISFNNDYNT